MTKCIVLLSDMMAVNRVKSTIRVAMVKLKNILKAEQGRSYGAEV